MPGIEVQILNLKLPSVNDFSKVRCVFTIGSNNQSTTYPFKPLIFATVDNYSVLSVSIAQADKIIGGVDIPLTLIQTKKSSTFRLSDTYNTPDRKKQSPNRLKGDPAEITIALKSLITPEEAKLTGGALQKKLEEATEMLDESYKSRRELQLSIEETTQQLSDMIKNQDNIIKQYLSEKQESSGKIKHLEDTLAGEKGKAVVVLLKNQELEALIDSNKSTEREYKIVEKWYEEVNSKTDDYARQQNSLIDKMKASNAEFQERAAEYQAKVESLVNDKMILMKTIEGLQKENHNLKKENDHLSSELLKAKSKLAAMEGEAIHNLAQRSKETELTERLRTTESLVISLKEELARVSIANKEHLNKLISGKNQVLIDNKDLQAILAQNDKSLAEKEIELEKLIQENTKLLANIACMEQHLCIKEDSNQIMDDMEKSLKSLRQETKNQKTTIEEQEHALIFNQKKLDELEFVMREKEEEVEILMSTVLKLQNNREMYVPIQGDPVDSALADYINTLDCPLTVPITREEEGIYIFGTKRIFVKLEQGKIIIRVGGGFMQINEFIDVYTSNEVDKFARERADRAQRLRLSLIGKLSDGSEPKSPGKYSACFGVQKRTSSASRSTISPANHTGSL